jgi:UDPglucose--hexose-1-phosphate uridylyltransferase
MNGVHRRWNPLTRRWVLVSPHRMQRPWQGQEDAPVAVPEAAYDPGCYLCPGNSRANGETNPAYAGTFAFDNDFAALLPDLRAAVGPTDSLLRAEPEAGLCRVLCYSPHHSLTMGRMTAAQIADVVRLWRAEFAALAAVPWIRSIQIIENRGAMMGASNPHPHGQIWANQTVPDEIALETETQGEYWATNGRSLLGAALAEELAAGERIVCFNAHFVALVPFWAVWPFETMIVPRRHYGSLAEQTAEEDEALAGILGEMIRRYDRVFQAPFPYSFGLHQNPVHSGPQPGWHFHAHFYPPLLRSATVRKYLVGYEMLAQPQRDITAEAAAARLRDSE